MPPHLRALDVDDDEVVVLLQAHHGLVVRVDVDVLGLGIGRRDGGQAGERDRPQAHGAEVEDLQHAGRGLGDEPVADVLVALVLDHDRRVAAIGGDVDRVGLPGERDRRQDRVRARVHDREPAARRDEARARVDRDERAVAHGGDARRLAAHVDRPAGAWRAGPADVDEAEPAGRRVRVDQRPPVGRRVDDLRRGHGRLRLAGTQVRRHVERARVIERAGVRRPAVLPMRRRRSRQRRGGDRGGERRAALRAQPHGLPPRPV